MLPSQVSPPEFAFSGSAPTAMGGVEVAAVPVRPGADGPEIGPGAEDVDADLAGALAFAGATGAAGEVVTVPCRPTPGDSDLRCVLLVGVGDARAADLRRAGAAVARATRDREAVACSLLAATDDPAALRAFVAGVVLASFGLHVGSRGPRFRPVARVVLALTPEDAADGDALARALAVAGAGWRSRALATVPSNIKNPPWLADQAREVAAAAGLKATVLDEEDLASEGFGGLLAVGAASATPPRLVRLEYTPPRRRRQPGHVVLVGKGITFDSGGLSIKPAEAMATMKRDMTGAGVVLAAMAALRDVDCPVRVTGLLCLAENAVGGNAVRPGDVITHYGGRTSEVTNTDAEGRLVLADGLAYAVAELKPDVLVDVATLTGGVKVALGQRLGGLFSNDDALHDLIHAAGAAAGEPFWRMPLAPIYEERVASSKLADADNAPGHAPAITAALFLQHFAGGRPWAHLDIASVGDAPEDRDEWTAGPTGFGARALLHWLEQENPLAGLRS